jgi:hypothetical protein
MAFLYLFIAWAYHAGSINPFTHLIGGGDGFIQGIASKTFATSFTSWNPYVQSGKFVFADVLYQSFYPIGIGIFSIFPHTFGFNLFLLIHYALAGLFVYLYLGSLRLTKYSAFIGGLVFMLCGFLTAHKGHEYIVCAAVWLPLTLYFIHRYAERLRILDLGYASIPVGLSILAGFPQITFYSMLLLILYIPFCLAGSPMLEGWKTKLSHIAFSEFVVLGVGGLLGCLPVLSVAESLASFTRERIDYGGFTSDNFPPSQLFTFLIPNFFGGVNRHIPAYAPDTTVFVAEVYGYIGLIPLTLGLAGISGWRKARRELKFWSVVTLVALFISFGGATPIYLLLFHVPVYNLFRVPARHLFEIDLALSVIAAIGLDALLAQAKTATAEQAALVHRALIWMSILMGISLLAAMTLRSLAAGWLSWFFAIPDSVKLNYCYTFGAVKQAMIKNLSVTSPTIGMPLLFFILTVGVLFFLLGKRPPMTALIVIPIFIAADTYVASHRMYDNPSTELLYGTSDRPEMDFLRSRQFDSDHYRLFPVDFDVGSIARLASTYHLPLVYPYPLLNIFSALPVINDYGPFWMKRYQAVTGFSAGGSMPVENLQRYKVLSLLGTRYLLALSPESKQSIEQAALDQEPDSEKSKAFARVAVTPNGITIYENLSVLPRFRFIDHILPAQNLEDALSLMNRPGFNPAVEAVVEGINANKQISPGTILKEKLQATRLQWEVETSGQSFFVVADSFFPGWTAIVDGRPVPIYAVYGCVRGILIETGGRHHVEMNFVPPGLGPGLAGTGLGLLILGLFWWGDRTGRMNRFSLERGARLLRRQYRAGAV